MAEITFQEACLLELDRIERSMRILREQLQAADEFLLHARERVDEIIQEKAPKLPGFVVQSDLPQSIGLSASWQDGTFVVVLTHRGGDFETLLPPQQALEVEVPGAAVSQ